MSADSPQVIVNPSMQFGWPNVKGCSVDTIVGYLAAGESVAEVADEYDLTRADVLVAAWYVGQFGLTSTPRAWRKALREWSVDAGHAMWNSKTCDYEAIPDPPIGDDKEGSP